MANRLLFIAVMWLAPQFAWAVGALEIFSPVVKPSAQVAADMAALSLPTQAQAVTPVDLNIAELAALAPNAEVNFTLPGNRGSYPVVYERIETAPGGNVSWIGYLKEFGKNYRAILTSGPGGAYGRILTPEGEFKLHSVAGSQWLIDTAAANLKPFTTKEDDSLIPPIATSLPKQGEDLPVSAAVTPSPQTTIDLMVLYTPGLVTRLGSVSAAQARIANLVAISNQAYIDSEVAITLRLVHTAQVNYSDSATQSTALNALTGGTDPALAGVATLRTTYGADLVVLMRPFVQAMNNCGLAWIGGSNNTPISGYAAYGYSAVLDGTNNGYYCDDLTFVHELGHNMGSMHDRVTLSIPSGPSGGAYSYSFGYGVGNAFTTVMAYPSSYTSAPRIGRFSNPYLYTCGGMACGVSETASNSANNALSLNNTRAGVANFKPSVTAPCTYTLSSSSFSTGAATAIGNVSVTTTTGCAWTARSNAAWITVISGASGSGNGSVGYSVAANTGASRTGAMTIAGKTFTVTQNGAGTLPSAPTIGTATAGNGSVRVAFTPGAIGSGTLLNYTAMCGTIIATGTSSPITVNGLTNGTAYTCKVRTASTVGIGPWSAVSNSVTPSGGGTIAGSLTTTFAGLTYGANGNMFDVKALSGNVTINRFALNLYATAGTIVPVRVYYKTGSYSGYEAISSAWTLLGTYSVTSAGYSKPSSMPVGNLLLTGGQTYGIYLTATDGTPFLYTSSANTYSNADLQATLGAGVYYPFAGTYTPRTWNGTIYYSRTGTSGTLPAAPTIGTATAGNGSARIAFTPGVIGSGTLVNYTAMCGAISATGTSSPITVTGLTNGTAYTCKVRTTSTVGIGPWSALSNAVTPIALLTSACSAITPATASVTLGAASPLLTATCSNTPTAWVWRLNGVAITGCPTTASTCTVPAVSLPIAGASYAVTVTANNAGGAGTQAARATITVTTGTPLACPLSLTEKLFDFATPGVTQDIAMSRGQAIAFKFTTDISGRTGLIQTALPPTGAGVYRFMNISEKKCDFSYTSYDSGNGCAATGSSLTIVNYTLGAPQPGVCSLKPYTTYYANIRNENVTSMATRGIDSCPAGMTCGFIGALF